MINLEISLFPIPGSVSLPYSTVPLHVFEPRYRKMISDSIKDNRRIGVSHTKRMIKSKQETLKVSLEEQLNSNHESYESYGIFSAGFAEILEVLPDGRLIVQIKMDSRYEMQDEIQQVPYKIVNCTEYKDIDPILENFSRIQFLRESLDEIFIVLAKENSQKEEMIEFIKSENWKNMSPQEYSFAIYALIQFDPETMQNVLELTSCYERINFLKETLENVSSRH